jgi:hypothetical protein
MMVAPLALLAAEASSSAATLPTLLLLLLALTPSINLASAAEWLTDCSCKRSSSDTTPAQPHQQHSTVAACLDKV